ncbi:MAG TPA: PhoU domain-containing protein, partial [Negativicutes bacterium]
MTSTRQGYNQELEALRKEILEMGTLVSQAITDAVQSLSKQDMELAQRVMAGDDQIDNLEIDIEDKCMV